MSAQPTSKALQGEVNRLKLELHTMHTERGTSEITVANYILTRLVQLGVTVITDPLS